MTSDSRGQEQGLKQNVTGLLADVTLYKEQDVTDKIAYKKS